MDDQLEQWLHADRNLGETLDRLVEFYDDAFSRLRGEVMLYLPKPKGMPNRNETIGATITCYFERPINAETKKDMRWALEFFGPPTNAVLGHSVSWHFGHWRTMRHGDHVVWNVVNEVENAAHT